MKNGKFTIRQFSALTLGILAVVLAIEVSLQTVAFFTTKPLYMEDPVLGFRPRPKAGDHDSRGFRNAEALRSADIVCLGDSQTYGPPYGVREEAWPQRRLLR